MRKIKTAEQALFSMLDIALVPNKNDLARPIYEQCLQVAIDLGYNSEKDLTKN